jgi:uncharacterized protein YecE (DUF72 family)
MPVYIGTSGWIYSDWKGKFYPEELRRQRELEFYSQHFNTVELNASFYRLPLEKTFSNWYLRTPKDFIFSVKVSRFITHVKRFKDVQESWILFLSRVSNLKEKLGPLLFQLPPSFHNNQENFFRIKNFLKQTNEKELKLAFEFRHPSWFDVQVYELLKDYNIAWVISDSSRWAKTEVITTDFMYIRFHGPSELFASKYSSREIKEWGEKIEKWNKSKKIKNIFIYFNNDFNCYAIENALELKNFLSL